MKQNKLKTGITLFLFFFKIGCFTFGGGWSILAQMEQEFVQKKKWITREELLDLTAVGKTVPGIMITNISMLFGYSVAGWFGGVCAVIGIACPAVLILSIVTFFYQQLKDNELCFAMLKGIRCAVVPIMGSAALSLGKDVFKTKAGSTIGLLAFLAFLLFDIGNVTMILIGIGAALLWWCVEKRRAAEMRG